MAPITLQLNLKDPGTISATTPAGTGTVDVVVEHPDGNGTLASAFTYS